MKQYKNKALLSVFFLIIMLLSTGCQAYDNFVASFGATVVEEDVIKIGIFEPLSGKDKEFGLLETAGIELANEIYPSIEGKKIQLVYADNKSDLVTAETAAKQLIEAGVDIVLGSYGNTLSMVGGELFREANIPAIAITPTNPLVTRGNPYYFRVSIVDSFQGVMAAKFVKNELGAERIAVMKAVDDDYGAALSQEFTAKMETSVGEEAKKEIVTVEYAKDEIDYSSALETIKAADSQVVYLPCSAKEGLAIVTQAKSMGITATFLGTDLWHEEIMITDGGNAAEGMIFTTFFDAESSLNPKTEEFLTAYHKKYGADKTPESAVAFGFDAYLLALDAIERQLNVAKGTGDDTCLREILQQTKQFEGATGSITFDANGDPIKSVVFIAVENGEFIYKYTTEPEWE
jgi:branched-chain amino acid transport system substrate-binding protein